jgi:4-hydroxybenzoate polyprenyltransferase
MISLLHQKDYELLGNIEIREADWLRIRRTGLVRFIYLCCASSWGARISAGFLLTAGIRCFESHQVDTTAWFLLVFGVWGVAYSVIYSVRVWHRLEDRFTRN